MKDLKALVLIGAAGLVLTAPAFVTGALAPVTGQSDRSSCIGSDCRDSGELIGGSMNPTSPSASPGTSPSR